MFDIGIELVLLLFVAGLIAGTVDSIAGGGGLITVPVLMFAGLSPAQALATNKLQSSFGSFAAAFYFVRKGLVNPRQILGLITITFIGSVLGTLLVQRIDASFLSSLIPILLILIAIYFIFSPRMSEEDAAKRFSMPLFAVTVGFGVGFYDGFFGPGTGSFFAIGFVTLLGYGLTKATAHTKVLNFTSNIASLLFFMAGGQVVWLLGLAMGMGQLIGGTIGARLVVKQGAGLIRPLVVVICVLMSIKLLLD